MSDNDRAMRIRQMIHQIMELERSMTDIATDTLVRTHDAEAALKWLQHVGELAKMREEIEAGLEYLDVSSFRPH